MYQFKKSKIKVFLSANILLISNLAMAQLAPETQYEIQAGFRQKIQESFKKSSPLHPQKPKNWTTEDQKNWEENLRQYYRNYLGNETTLSASDRDAKLLEASQYFDNSNTNANAKSLDPHKHVLPPVSGIVSSAGSVSNFVNQKTKNTSFDLILCPINETNRKLFNISKVDAKAWNDAFPKLRNSKLGLVAQFGTKAEFDDGIKAFCKDAGVKECNGDFKDALKKSAAKWESTETTKTTVVEEKHPTERKTKIKWKIEPLIYFNIDFEKKITNLSPYHNPSVPLPPDSEQDLTIPTYEADKILLKPASRSSYGYEINESRTFGIGGGAGVQSVIEYSSPGWSFLKQFGVFAGAMVIYSKVNGANYFTTDLDQKMSSDLKKPTLENITQNWKVGQSYNYTMDHWGILLTGGTHWMSIAMGPTYIHDASSKHVVTKIAPQKVIVEVTDLAVDSVSATIGVGLLSYSRVLLNDLPKLKNAYLYDLSLDAGRKAFVQIMNGNYYDTQALIADKKTVGVIALERDTSKVDLSSGGDFMSSWYFGIPFVYWNWMDGKTSEKGYLEKAYLEKFVDAVDSRYYHGLYFDNFHRRIIFDHKYVTLAFYSAIQNSGSQNMTYATTQDYYGRFVWNYQAETAVRSTLRDQLDKMIYSLTGLEELDVNMKDITSNLGYANAEVIMDLDKNSTDALMTTGISEGTSSLLSYTQRAVDHFNAAKDPEVKKYCYELGYTGYILPKDKTQHLSMETFATTKLKCVSFLRNESLSIVRQMASLLAKMKKNADATDDASKKEFAQDYREFGRLMTSSRFAFRAVYDFLVNTGTVDLDSGIKDFVRYTINGEKLTNMTVYFPSGKLEKSLSLIER